MLPYIRLPDTCYDQGKIVGGPHIWLLPLHPFGILVATGVLVGSSLAMRRARLLGYDLVKLNSFVTWMLVFGFVLSHFLDDLFYNWELVVRDPKELFLPWKGLSSFGGFVGALVGILAWKYFELDGWRPRLRPQPHPILPYADLVLSVFPFGWMFGRAGCSSVHDHPGMRTTADTLLAVSYPQQPPAPCQPLHPGDGTVTHFGFIEFIHGRDFRFDLGLLELMFTIILAACFALTWRRRLAIGTYVVASALAYAPVRFAMDFLRVPEQQGGDTRYANLTPAQWACIALFVYGLFMIGYMRRLRLRGIDLRAAVLAQPSLDSGASAGQNAAATGS